MKPSPGNLRQPYEKLGQLIVLHNMMEAALAHLLVAITNMTPAGIAVRVINTLEYRRKTELLKAFGTIFTTRKAELRKISDLAERLGGVRNQAAHSVIGYRDGQAEFVAMGGPRSIGTWSKAPLKVSDISTAASDAEKLHKLILAEIKVWEVNHTVVATVQKVVDDPEKRQAVFRILEEAMAQRSEDAE